MSSTASLGGSALPAFSCLIIVFAVISDAVVCLAVPLAQLASAPMHCKYCILVAMNLYMLEGAVMVKQVRLILHRIQPAMRFNLQCN